MSFREEDPFIAWFLTDELFRQRPLTEVFLERYPCSLAKVTARQFEAPMHGFPNRRQLLADDLVRCHLLKRMTPHEVISIAGAPSERFTEEGRLSFVYWLGPERDSLVQIDEEGLQIDFSGMRVRTARIFQG